MPCRDVDGCVHVSIANKVAGYAGEERLALAALGCDVPACATALRSVSRADPLDPAGSLLFQSANQQSPARTHDLAVEPCFRTDVTSWVPSRTPGRARHTRDAQVLDTNQVEPPRKVRAGFLDPVFAHVGFSRAQPSDSQLRLGPSLRPPAGSRNLALQAPQPALSAGAEPGDHQHLARRQRRAHCSPAVDTDHLASAWRKDGF